MVITTEKITKLSREYALKIEQAQSQIQALRETIARLTAKKEVYDELAGESKSSPFDGDDFLGKGGPYEGMETTPAVLAVLNSSDGFLTTGEIIALLSKGGFDSGASKHWKAAVYTACGRLAEMGKIVQTEKQGKKAFMKKP